MWHEAAVPAKRLHGGRERLTMSELRERRGRRPRPALILDRAEKRNALNGELMLALRDAAREAADDPDVQCVVMRGEGPAFSAGMDVFELGSLARRPRCCGRSGAPASRR